MQSYNGWQAREALREHAVDVVLVDLELPDTNGFQLVEEITCDRDAPAIVIISAHAEIPNVVRAVRSGAVDFVEKSHENYRKLTERIDTALAIRAGSRDGVPAQALQRSAIWLTGENWRERAADAFRECGRALIAPSTSTEAVSELHDRPRSLYRTLRDHFETLVIRVAVARCGGSKRAAANALGVSYSTVMKKLGDLDLR